MIIGIENNTSYFEIDYYPVFLIFDKDEILEVLEKLGYEQKPKAIIKIENGFFCVWDNGDFLKITTY